MISINQITPQIFVGSAPKDHNDVQKLSVKYKINSVISLQTDQDMQLRNIDIPSLERVYQSIDIEFNRFPIIDVDAQDMAKKIILPIHHLINQVKQNKTVYVHCNAGICRANSTVLGYLYLYEGMTLKEGLQYIRERRPIANPYVSAVSEAIKQFEYK